MWTWCQDNLITRFLSAIAKERRRAKWQILWVDYKLIYIKLRSSVSCGCKCSFQNRYTKLWLDMHNLTEFSEKLLWCTIPPFPVPSKDEFTVRIVEVKIQYLSQLVVIIEGSMTFYQQLVKFDNKRHWTRKNFNITGNHWKLPSSLIPGKMTSRKLGTHNRYKCKERPIVLMVTNSTICWPLSLNLEPILTAVPQHNNNLDNNETPA